MELLRTLVEAGTRRSEAASTASSGTSLGEDKVKQSKLSEEDDIEAYLTTFERMMTAYEVQINRWPFKLAPMLTGEGTTSVCSNETTQRSRPQFYVATTSVKRLIVNVSG